MGKLFGSRCLCGLVAAGFAAFVAAFAKNAGRSPTAPAFYANAATNEGGSAATGNDLSCAAGFAAFVAAFAKNAGKSPTAPAFYANAATNEGASVATNEGANAATGTDLSSLFAPHAALELFTHQKAPIHWK